MRLKLVLDGHEEVGGVQMGPFIERSAAGFTPEQYTEAAAAYGEAMMLLYRNDRGCSRARVRGP